MGRGGRRVGAGRRPKLTEWQRLTVGRECEEAWRGLHAAAVQRAAGEHLGADLTNAFRALRVARDDGVSACALDRLKIAARREVRSLETLPTTERGVIRVFHQLDGMRANIVRLAAKHNVSVRETYKCWNDYRAVVERAEAAP